MRIAVVIPTLNESAHLAATIRSLDAGRPDVVVVADCNSADDTVEIARAAGVIVVEGSELNCRGSALRAGAERALSELETAEGIHQVPGAGAGAIWFLHADTLAPPDWRDAIEVVLADRAVVGGAFTQRFTTNPPGGGPRPTHLQRRLLRFTIFANRTRYFFTSIYFGDQGIFVTTAGLQKIGGVPPLPLMEDVELCRQLQRVGKLRISPVRLSTSPRRFLKHGVLRQLLRDWTLLLRHRLGLNSTSHHQHYNQDNHEHTSSPGNFPHTTENTTAT